MLEAADGPMRLLTIGQMLLIAVLFLRPDPTQRRASSPVGTLILSVMAYLVVSGPWQVGHVSPILGGVAAMIPFALWAVIGTLFDDRFRLSWWHHLAFAMILAASLGISFLPDHQHLGRNVVRVLGLVVMVHAIWVVLKGIPDDLIEGRRLARTGVVALAAVLVISSLTVEIALPDFADREPLEPLNALLILVCTTLFGWALLTPIDLVRQTGLADAPEPEVPLKAANDKDLVHRIEAFIASGGLFQPGLTVGSMAERVGMPEYLMRRTINGEMGFRNFSAFLNHHRISEAKRRLNDPEYQRLPILTIAMDLGYGSVGPFNRAFREATGITPSTWRMDSDPEKSR